MVRFQNYVSFVLIIKKLRFMVQKTSILSKDFNADILISKFLQFTHKSKFLYIMLISQKSGKCQIFKKIIYGMSSYWGEFWRLEMQSLGVLDVFCTNSECGTISRCNFMIWWIFVIFEIFNCGSKFSNLEIGRYRPEKYVEMLKMCSLMLKPYYI